MKRRWCRKHLSQPPELNITAFMNLMVILVPFLLITAVFSRITILELNLPKAASGEQAPDQEQAMDLEVIVRQGTIEVGDKQVGHLQTFYATADGSELHDLSDLLQQIKARFPDKTDVTLLLEAEIPYERLVDVMDTLRVARIERDGERVQAELFPVISIGDAATRAMKTAQSESP
jgi:biopolymer transport protein ExbD